MGQSSSIFQFVVTQQWAKWKVSAPNCLQIAWKTRTVRNTPRRNLSKNNENTQFRTLFPSRGHECLLNGSCILMFDVQQELVHWICDTWIILMLKHFPWPHHPSVSEVIFRASPGTLRVQAFEL
jgi:hypothetical protein